MTRRLLLFTTDLEIGGTPTVVRELAIRLRRRCAEWHVEVACLAPIGPVGRQLLDAGVPVTTLDAIGPSDWRVLPRLVRLMHDRGFDTVLSFLVHANVVAAMARPACPRSVRWLQSIQTTQPYPRWHWLAQAAAQYAAEKIVVPSASVADAARDWSHIPREKIIVIPNAVDPAEFDALRNVPRPANQIGFIGRLDPIKRIPDLLRAVELLDKEDVHLHIFGDGPQRGEIERQIALRRLERRVTLHGAVSRPRQALSRIGLLVLPSQAEGFGLVLIEAMAAGVPVVATDAPGIRDVVRDGYNGLLAPVASPEKLTDAIRCMCGNPARRAEFVRQGLQDVREKFSWSKVIERYLDLALIDPVFISAQGVSGQEKVTDILRRLPADASSKADIDLQLRAERDFWEDG